MVNKSVSYALGQALSTVHVHHVLEKNFVRVRLRWNSHPSSFLVLGRKLFLYAAHSRVFSWRMEFQPHLLANVHSLRQVVWLLMYRTTNSLEGVLTSLEIWLTKTFLGKPERLKFWQKIMKIINCFYIQRKIKRDSLDNLIYILYIYIFFC